MSLYSRDDERSIRVQRLVEDWTRSGLLQAEQRDRIMPELQVDLRRTNRFLRVTLFLFGYLIANAAVGLVLAVVGFHEEVFTWLALVAAAASFWTARRLVTRYRLYHFGVEEAAAVASVSFVVFFAATVFGSDFSTLMAFAAATAGAVVLFVYFGYLYAGIAALAFAAMTLFDLDQVDTVRRLLVLLLMLTVFFVARERRDDHAPDYPADHYGIIQAVAWAAMYVVVNFKISEWISIPDGYQTIYWITYGLIWLLPFAGLWMAIRDRHRALLDVNIVLLIVTMMSNKPYLGVAQQPWDPVLFGLMLIAIAVGVRRWLASGGAGSRGGFVAERILESERDRIALAGSATVFVPGAPAAAPEEPSQFGGGRSGGAGASGNF